MAMAMTFNYLITFVFAYCKIYILLFHIVPLLLDLLVTTAATWRNKPGESVIPALCAAYAVLMKCIDAHLSAFHRMVSVVLIKGHCDDEVS